MGPGESPLLQWLPELRSENRGVHLANLLYACSNSVALGNFEEANFYLEHINHFASADGDSMQRIAAYFTEALAVRLVKVWPALDSALHSTKTCFVSDQVRGLFFDLYPFLRVGYLVTNQAIAEFMAKENTIHVIDLSPSRPSQWSHLLRLLNARPRKPVLKITCVHEQQEVLHQMKKLIDEARELGLPFKFHAVQCRLEDLVRDFTNLPIEKGDSIAVSVALVLHTLLETHDHDGAVRNSPSASKHPICNPLQRVLQLNQRRQTLGEWIAKDEVNIHGCSPSSSLSPLTVPPSPKVESFLSAVQAISPKLMLVTEQDSNHNGPTLTERVRESLPFYATLFDRLEDSPTTRASTERKMLEKWMFGEEIKNIISCEGTERKERHEKIEKWTMRLIQARFEGIPLTLHGNVPAHSLLRSYGYGYVVKDENGCLVLCWNDKPLFSISAWKCKGVISQYLNA